MSEGRDRTGLGPLRIPIFAGAAGFFFWKGLSNILEPPEIIAVGNATLIQSRAGFNPNTMMGWIFGIGMMLGGVLFAFATIVFVYTYMIKPKEAVSI